MKKCKVCGKKYKKHKYNSVEVRATKVSLWVRVCPSCMKRVEEVAAKHLRNTLDQSDITA